MITALGRVVSEDTRSGLPRTNDAPEHYVPSEDTKAQIRPKILIVDDEPDIVTSLTKRFHYAGYDVATAYDGHSATAAAVKAPPDVVILDIGMPCGDGHTVAERIRTNPNTMFAQIIFLTARVNEPDRQKAMQAGAYGYMTKPFKPEALLEMVDSALADSHF